MKGEGIGSGSNSRKEEPRPHPLNQGTLPPSPDLSAETPDPSSCPEERGSGPTGGRQLPLRAFGQQVAAGIPTPLTQGGSWTGKATGHLPPPVSFHWLGVPMRGRGRWGGGQRWAEIKWQGTPAPLRILVPEPRAKVSFWTFWKGPFPPPVRVCLLKQRGESHPQAMFTLLSSPNQLPMGRGCVPPILQMKELRHLQTVQTGSTTLYTHKGLGQEKPSRQARPRLWSPKGNL